MYLKLGGYCRPYSGNGNAALKGRFVHEATTLLDHGRLDRARLDPALVGYVRAYELFRQEFGFVPDLEWRERPCFNPIYRYAGTADAIGMTNVGPAIVELKTGAPEKWHHLQCGGGYAPMIAAHRPEYAKADRLLVYLSEEGTYRGEKIDAKQLPMLFASIVACVNGRSLYGNYNNGA